MPLIVDTILEPTAARRLERLLMPSPDAHLLELRIDASEQPLAELEALAPVVRSRRQPIILTCRSVAGGGRFRGTLAAKLEVLRAGARLAQPDGGVQYVDLEEHDPRPPFDPSVRVIRSLHDFDRVPSNLDERASAMVARGADIIKVACRADRMADAMHVATLPRRLHQPCVAIAMGARSGFTRILGGAFGTPIIFGTAGSEPAAPGQVSVADLVRVYRAHEITPVTPVFALIGHPVSHSLSPLIHNRALQHMGLPGTYVAIDCEQIAELDVLASIPIKGFSVTLPHKERALDWAGEREPAAERVRAANTLYRRGPHMVAANTDYEGFLDALREAAPELHGKAALVVGAGGAARAVAWALKDQGARVSIANRTAAKSASLARDCDVDHIAMSALGNRTVDLPAFDLPAFDLPAFDLIVQCTSCGMSPSTDESPVPAALFRPGQVAFDLVYHPLETRFLREARHRGATPVSGLAMLAYQARGQLLRWVGQAPAPEVMRALAADAAAARGLVRE